MIKHSSFKQLLFKNSILKLENEIQNSKVNFTKNFSEYFSKTEICFQKYTNCKEKNEELKSQKIDWVKDKKRYGGKDNNPSHQIINSYWTNIHLQTDVKLQYKLLSNALGEYNLNNEINHNHQLFIEALQSDIKQSLGNLSLSSCALEWVIPEAIKNKDIDYLKKVYNSPRSIQIYSDVFNELLSCTTKQNSTNKKSEKNIEHSNFIISNQILNYRKDQNRLYQTIEDAIIKLEGEIILDKFNFSIKTLDSAYYENNLTLYKKLHDNNNQKIHAEIFDEEINTDNQQKFANEQKYAS